MGRILRYMLAGVIGMLAAWIVMEPTPLMPDVERDIAYSQTFLIGLIAGTSVGLMLGIAESLSAASSRHAIKGIAVSAAFGAAGGIIGLTMGSRVYSVLFTMAHSAGLFSFLLKLIGRGFGWALIGALIGISHGVATTNTKKIINGGVGGFVGGGLGGSVFEILVWMNKGGVANFAPAMIRFIAFSVTGAAIGLFLGFVAEITKQAWLIKLVGRNEGREILLNRPVTVLGRDEYADIPVFGDPDVAERHAVITALGNRHQIEDAGSFYGTRLNGNKLTGREFLTDGDLLEIGKTKFKYGDKATARSASAPYSAPAQIPASTHICRFCGAIKDAAGNCDCTVTAPAPTHAATSIGDQTMPMQTAHKQGARLIGFSGPYANQTFLIDKETHIGRESAKDIALPLDNSVSRNHARIAIEGDSYIIYDDGSTNGTHVNNARITRHQLAPNDTVQIGSTKFRVEID